MAERHLSQHVALRKNSRYPILAVNHRYRSHVVIEHFMNRIGHGCFQSHSSNLPVTKFQHAHKHLRQPPPEAEGRILPGLTHYDRGGTLVKEICRKIFGSAGLEWSF